MITPDVTAATEAAGIALRELQASINAGEERLKIQRQAIAPLERVIAGAEYIRPQSAGTLKGDPLTQAMKAVDKREKEEAA